jgi:hypothetical protein
MSSHALAKESCNFTIYNDTGKDLILDLGNQETRSLKKKDGKFVIKDFTDTVSFSLYKEKKGAKGDFFGGYTINKAKDLTKKDKADELAYSITITKAGKKGFSVGPKASYLSVSAQ